LGALVNKEEATLAGAASLVLPATLSLIDAAQATRGRTGRVSVSDGGTELIGTIDVERILDVALGGA
jgi:hypothetical protein